MSADHALATLCLARRRFRVCLTDSDHNLHVAANRLLGRCQPVRPDAVWWPEQSPTGPRPKAGSTWPGLDRCSRRCVGWAMSDTLATSLPLAALTWP